MAFNNLSEVEFMCLDVILIFIQFLMQSAKKSYNLKRTYS